MKLQLITHEQALKITNVSQAQLRVWIEDGKLEMYEDMIVASSLKALLQAKLLRKLTFKFEESIRNNYELLSNYKQIRRLEQESKQEKDKPVIKNTEHKMDDRSPKSNILLIITLLAGVAGLIYLFS